MSGNRCLKINDLIQIVIAGILFLTLLVLYFNLDAFWKQIRLTQTLNEPLIAVKNVEVTTSTEDKKVMGISVIIKNFGNYVAKDASYEWEFQPLVKTKEIRAFSWKPSGAPVYRGKKEEVTILPQHEFKQLLLFIETDFLNEMIQGYEKALSLRFNLKYQGMDGGLKEYSCAYEITKLLTGIPDAFEVFFEKSKLNTGKGI